MTIQTMAFSTSGQNMPPSYIDRLSVKITEKYKPPKRITSALSYSQITALNKIIQDSIPSYEFSLEENIKKMVNERIQTRSLIVEERKQRLEILKQELNNKKWNQCENTSNDSSNETKVTNDTINNKETETPTGHFYKTESGVLIPMTASAMQQSTGPAYQIQNFNYSEFESDTSSPFDNMELKTINDLEELAEVLKRDCDINSTTVVQNAVNNQSVNLTNVVKNNYVNSYSKYV